MSIAALVAAAALKRSPIKSNAVFALQTALLQLRDLDDHADGYFGPRTEAAVKQFQSLHALPETGIVDRETAEKIDAALARATVAPVLATSGDPPWFVIATSLLGIYEFTGNADNPTIIGWARELGGTIAKTYKHDSIPWCQLFVQYCLYKAGFPHLDSLWALDNANYGQRLTGPARGAIGTKKRDAGGHTFFIVGRSSSGNIVMRGGNQSDMVCDAEIEPDQVYSVTWPKGYPIPKVGLASLPIVKSAPRSKREA